jgi:hypothetical protein
LTLTPLSGILEYGAGSALIRGANVFAKRGTRWEEAMSRIHWIVMATGLALLTAGLAPTASAKGKKAAAPAAAPKALNACGCYADNAGTCFCGRRGKCECPGECEPKGCEEKRAKQMAKDIAAETKKAAEADRKERHSESTRVDRPDDTPKPKPKPADKGDESTAK